MFENALTLFNKHKDDPHILSGDPFFDNLLQSGLVQGMIYLLIAPRKSAEYLLMALAVHYLCEVNLEGSVTFVDGLNRFNPYWISKEALHFHKNPTQILKKIQVARAFNWNQMTELLAERIPTEKRLGNLILISGITQEWETMLETFNQGTRGAPNVFNDLKAMQTGLQRAAREGSTVVLTAPLHSKSQIKPAGGNLLLHFAQVIVRIIPALRKITYFLDQHPFYPAQNLVCPIRLPSKRSLRSPDQSKNLRLDAFLVQKK
ncbi:MAG: hypothetical protein ACTSXK_06905 [Promethearchaeota archaeon]